MQEFRWENLRKLNSADFIQAFKTMPQHSSCLYQSYIFDNRSEKELAQAFSNIPSNITSVNLSFNKENPEYNRPGFSAPDYFKKLLAVLTHLPRTVTSLNLRYNYLRYLSVNELIILFTSIPRTIRKLDLGYNYLFESCSVVGIKAILASLPLNIVKLDLAVAFLRISWERYDAMLTSIPTNVTTLNLNSDRTFSTKFLIGFSFFQLQKFFKSLPASVTSLNLTNIGMEELSGRELKWVLASLPTTLTYLNLSNNKLGRRTAGELAEAFSQLSSNLTSLDLRKNEFSDVCVSTFLPSLRYLNHLYLEALTYYSTNYHFMLPPSLKSFDVHLGTNYYSSFKSWHIIAQLLATLPSTIKAVNFSQCELFEETVANISALFNALNPTVETLNLSSSAIFYSKDPAELAIVFRALPRTLLHLILKNNPIGLNDKVGKELPSIFMEFPSALKSLDLSNVARSPSDVKRLGHAFSWLPEQLETLYLSKSNLGHLSSDELIQLWKTIPTSVTALYLNKNGFYLKTATELALIFAALPRSLRILHLAGNRLTDFSASDLKQAFANLPLTIKVIHCEDNGFEHLSAKVLNEYTSAVPNGLVYLSHKTSFKLTNDGVLVPTYTQHHRLFTPKKYFYHHREFARLRIILMQLLQTHGLYLDIVMMLLSFILHASLNELTAFRHTLKHSLISSTPPTQLTEATEQATLEVVNHRINALTPGETTLDLSRCGLNRLRSQQFNLFFKAIPKSVTALNLRGNGFLFDERTQALFIEILANLPKEIMHLDLSAQGFEQLPAEKLQALLVHLPPTVKTLTFAQEKPLSLAHQLAIRQWPKSYGELTQMATSPIQKARLLLDDYTKGDSAVKRFFYGHWNRSHTNAVAMIVKAIDCGRLTQPEDVLQALEEIEKPNEIGSLSKRFAFLRFAKPSHQPQKALEEQPNRLIKPSKEEKPDEEMEMMALNH